MRIGAIVAALVASAGLAACWTNSDLPPPQSPEPPTTTAQPPASAAHRQPPPRRDWFDVALEQMSMFKDEMCACPDLACAQHVSEEMTAWSEAQQSQYETGKISDEQTELATHLGEEMSKCMQKALQIPPAATP